MGPPHTHAPFAPWTVSWKPSHSLRVRATRCLSAKFPARGRCSPTVSMSRSALSLIHIFAALYAEEELTTALVPFVDSGEVRTAGLTAAASILAWSPLREALRVATRQVRSPSKPLPMGGLEPVARQPVSYTHLDVYKRQLFAEGGIDRSTLEHVLGALARASQVRIVSDEFVKDGETIVFQRVYLESAGRSLSGPRGGIRMVAGPLGRAVVKISAVKPEHRVVEAPAICFEDVYKRQPTCCSR